MHIQCRTQATISLQRLSDNIRNIQSRLEPGVELIAVVKADSYGHGAAGLYPTFRCSTRFSMETFWRRVYSSP